MELETFDNEDKVVETELLLTGTFLSIKFAR